MSPASHMVGRLRQLYGFVLGKMWAPSRGLARRAEFCAQRHQSILEALEPRLLLSDTRGLAMAPYLPPQHWLINQNGYLSEPSAGQPLDIAMGI